MSWCLARTVIPGSEVSPDVSTAGQLFVSTRPVRNGSLAVTCCPRRLNKQCGVRDGLPGVRELRRREFIDCASGVSAKAPKLHVTCSTPI